MAAALVLAMTGPGLGHDGPHLARVVTDVLGARRDGREVTVSLRIESLEAAVTLVSATADVAETVAGTPGPVVHPGTPVEHSVRLRFADEVPKFFTLMLDFGAAGLGTVLVSPD